MMPDVDSTFHDLLQTVGDITFRISVEGLPAGRGKVFQNHTDFELLLLLCMYVR